MAATALQARETPTRRPHLRVASGASTKRKALARTNASVFQAFVFFAVVVSLVTLMGLGRVWLSVQAAQASIDSSRLRREIKLEQYQGDMLEVQQSALSTPTRIQALAVGTMGMKPATSVSYLDLRGGAASGNTGELASATDAPNTGVSAALSKVMEVAAGEAHVLLVGDVGLTSSR